MVPVPFHWTFHSTTRWRMPNYGTQSDLLLIGEGFASVYLLTRRVPSPQRSSRLDQGYIAWSIGSLLHGSTPSGDPMLLLVVNVDVNVHVQGVNTDVNNVEEEKTDDSNKAE